MTRANRVSVIVPTRNSSRTLEACLTSGAAQTVPVELVVVDNYSVDSTSDIARRHAQKVIAFGPERSAQRNEGVRRASGEFVAIVDSDMVLEPRVIEECLVAIDRPGVAGVIIPERSFGHGFWAECKALERSFYEGVDWMEAARFFRKEDFLAVGGYDESLVSGEDWDLSGRIATRGKLARIDVHILHDEGRLTLFGLLRKKAYYAVKFAAYAHKARRRADLARQTGVLARYGLFFSDPRRLFARPLVGCGMLLMKTCEFAVGACGYAYAALFRGK